MFKVQSFRDLEVWKEAHKLTLEIYRVTKNFPKEERYGLISQLRRSSSSVACNIAEGMGRNTTKEFLSFLLILAVHCKKPSITSYCLMICTI